MEAEPNTILGVLNSLLLLVLGVSIRGGGVKTMLRSLGEALASSESGSRSKSSDSGRALLEQIEGRIRKGIREEVEQATAPIRTDLARIESDLREHRRDTDRRLQQLEQSHAFTQGRLAPQILPADPTPVHGLPLPRNEKANNA